MIQDLYKNPLIMTDVYNLAHEDFKENKDWEVSYIYNRNAPMILYGFDEIVNRIFSTPITWEMVREGERYAKYMGVWFPSELFYEVIERCNGYFPVEVKAIEDGSWVPQGTPFAQVSNTLIGYGELVTWWEAKLLKAWFPSACATRAFAMRRYLQEHKYPLNKFHSFGYRSHRSEEDAYWCGTAWNLFLQGTDDFHTLQHDNLVKTGSIPALAHKVVQQFDVESRAYFRAITETARHGGKVVAIVIDTFDPWYFIENISEYVIESAKQNGVHVVFRPDSGNVFEQAETLLRMYDPSEASVIIGEGMSFEKAKLYDQQLIKDGVDPARLFYGIGGDFHNDLNRDTLGWAMKTAYSNGKDRMKFSMDRGKISLPGKMDVIKDADGQIKVIPVEDTQYYDTRSLYRILYHSFDGKNIVPFKINVHKNIERLDSARTLQSFIVVTDMLQQKINGFREKYIKRV